MQGALILLIGCGLSLGLTLGIASPALAIRDYGLPQGNAIKDPEALLRLALPVDNQPIRKIQSNLEDISNQIRGKRWGAIKRDISKARTVLNTQRADILASVPEARRQEAEELLKSINAGLSPLQAAVEAENKDQLEEAKSEILDQIGLLEAKMVDQFPFEVPSEYQNLPQLKGRATVSMVTDRGPLKIVVDGYSAPVTAGNFVDLVQRGFYDGLEFTRSEASYVLQTGDPPGPEAGFIDPETGEYRAVPLEILVRGQDQPIYGTTLEAAGFYKAEPVLPFSAYGALAMARPGDDPNGGSSQFFFFLFNPDLTPPGLNLLDGRYTIFGFVVDGQEVLEKLKEGDKIKSARVTQGAEHLVQPQVGSS